MFGDTLLPLTEEQVSLNEGEGFQHVSVIMNYLILSKGKQSKYITKQTVIIIVSVGIFVYDNKIMFTSTQHWKNACVQPEYLLISCRTECYDYLFDLAVQMKLHGLNPQHTPEQHELRIQNEGAALRNVK